VNKKKTPACRPSVRLLSLYFSLLFSTPSACAFRDSVVKRESRSLNLYIRCERSDRATDQPPPLVSRLTHFRFTASCDDPDFYFCCVSLSSYFPSPIPVGADAAAAIAAKVRGRGSLFLSLTPPGPLSCSAAFCVFDAKMTKPVRSLGCYRAASGGGGDNVRPEYKFRLRSPHGTKNRRVSSLFLAVVVVNDYISHVPLHLEYHTMYYCGRGRLGAQEPPRKGRS
jgi:hypothetical protein